MDDIYPFELVHLKSCRFSLGVQNKTSNLASRCELGRFPILISILKLLKLMHSYYCRLIKHPSDKLLYKLYQTDKQLFLQGSNSWLTNVRHLEKLLNRFQVLNLARFIYNAFKVREEKIRQLRY